jgi:hypothetical protein
MRLLTARLALASSLSLSIASAQVPTPEMDKLLSTAAQSLSEMQFDTNAPVTVRGHVTTLVWPVGASGMLVVKTDLGEFAFSTAKLPQMAKQGFTRFALHPGEEVIVTGVLASGKAKIGPRLNAARADLVTKSDGNRVFDRSRLP